MPNTLRVTPNPGQHPSSPGTAIGSCQGFRFNQVTGERFPVGDPSFIVCPERFVDDIVGGVYSLGLGDVHRIKIHPAIMHEIYRRMAPVIVNSPVVRDPILRMFGIDVLVTSLVPDDKFQIDTTKYTSLQGSISTLLEAIDIQIPGIKKLANEYCDYEIQEWEERWHRRKR